MFLPGPGEGLGLPRSHVFGNTVEDSNNWNMGLFAI